MSLNNIKCKVVKLQVFVFVCLSLYLKGLHADIEDAALCCRHLGYKGSARYLYGNLPVVFLNCSSKMPFVISQISQICCVHWRLQLVDVIAGERFFNLRLLWMRLHIVDEAKYERSENRYVSKQNMVFIFISMFQDLLFLLFHISILDIHCFGELVIIT